MCVYVGCVPAVSACDIHVYHMAIRKVRTHLLYTWWDLLSMDSRTWRFFKVHMCLLLIKEVLCLLILTENFSFLDTGVSRRKTDSWKVFSPYQAQYGWGTAADVLSRNRHFFVGFMVQLFCFWMNHSRDLILCSALAPWEVCCELYCIQTSPSMLLVWGMFSKNFLWIWAIHIVLAEHTMRQYHAVSSKDDKNFFPVMLITCDNC